MKNIRWKIAQWFEKKWWNNYLKNKNAKEYLNWKKKYWKSFLEDISVSFKADENILDIGCGPAGTFILSNVETSSNWSAIDPLLNNYINLSVFDKKNHQNVSFINKSFENFETRTKFDTIFCINAINHFKNIEENLNKLHFLLSENSNLIISIDTHNYKPLKWFFYLFPLDILHPHQYTETEYEKMFLENDFKIIKKKLSKKEIVFSYYVYVLKKNIT